MALTTPLLSLLFFLSGTSALIYQVVWQRLMTLTLGADTLSVAVIVGIFMLGLGCGNLFGGIVSDRLSPRRALISFLVLEGLIGVFGVLSSTLLYHQLYLSPLHLQGSPAVLSIVFMALLILPTSCMGATLPFICKAASRTVALAPKTITVLYAANLIGAAAGAALGAFILVPRIGFEGALIGAASLNGATALLGLLLSQGKTIHRVTLTEEAKSSTDSHPVHLPLWRSLYLVSGFVNLGLEMLWFRILGVLLKSNSFTFAYLLFLYLLGLGLGSLFSALCFKRSATSGRWFLRLQYAAVLYSGFSLLGLYHLLGSESSLGNVRAYLGGYEHLLIRENMLNPSRVFIALYGVIAPALIVVPTFLLGASFFFIQSECHRSIDRLGTTLGSLQTFNIIGATTGSILVGILALDLLGTSGAFLALLLISALYVAGLCILGVSKRERCVSSLACLLLIFTFPRGDALLSRLHGSKTTLPLIEDDSSGVAAIITGDPGRHYVFTNGLGQSWIPFGSIHSSLGLLPLFVHPLPKTVGVVGVGSGDTLFSAAGRNSVESVTAVEIIRPLLTLLPKVSDYPVLPALFSDPRIRIVYGDGRRALLSDGTRYDIIEADALRPTSAFSGNLYSKEYFELLRSRLAPSGIAVSWIPTERTLRTFTSVFPHTLLFPYIALGSNEEIPFDKDTVLARASDEFSKAYYGRAGIDHLSIINEAAGRVVRLGKDMREGLDVNTDLFPRDEYGFRE